MSNDIQISSKKDHWGKWFAESEIPLEGNQILKIRTAKSERGELVSRASAYERGRRGLIPGVALVSSASVYELERKDGYRIEKFVMFEDYYKIVYVAGKKVANEKAVRAQQALVLQDLPYILDNVKAFYAAKAVV